MKIREIMNIQHNITEVIKERRLKFLGRMKRMGCDRIPKMKLDWNGEGTRRKAMARKKVDGEIKKKLDQQKLYREDTGNKEFWKSKLSLGWRIRTVL